MAIGQTILALPIVTALTANAIESLDKRLRLTLTTLGAGRFSAAVTTLWEARYQVMAAAVTACGRVTAEVGASMMLGGNIKWRTRTITTAITLETNKGEFAAGIALGVILLLMALVLNAVLAFMKRRGE
jgi:tungstate transport system permease protein